MNASESSTVSEALPTSSSTPENSEKRPAKHDKRALVVFFSFVAGLVLLVALNMK